ncbi:MAG TPA: hypothetical protein VMI94_26275 [Bryobacteraceae bacterium]|nr:hypothetical protein [Bryobacteraceae bacterium]
MERLLAEEDYRFLSSQPGINGKALRRLRAERRKIFRGYLTCLRRDFSLVGAALRMMMLYSSHDRGDLAGVLYKQQALFALGMLAVEWRLVLHACGLGSVDVSNLVRAMENIRLELRHMIPTDAVATSAA